MGNSLTGLTPSTTYDALIKTGDNGPITSTPKTLSDGLGNDLPIEVSTTAVNFTNQLQQGGVAVPTASQVSAKQDTLVSGTNIKTVNSNSLLGSGNVIIDKTSVGLGNVANVDTTDASNISSGTLADARLSSAVTTQGNTFNTANKLVQLDASAKLPAVDGSQLTNLPIPTPPNGLLKIASAISTTLQTVTDYLGNLGVLQLSSRRVGILSDSGVTTQTSSVIQATTTNANLVIAPNGTGALIAQIPDGTATGGNARGNYAVDLQLVRLNANQVASGAGAFASGGENRATGTYSTAMGNVSVASGNYSLALGLSSTASGLNSIALGNANTASSSYSTISGGQSNTASTNTHATVVGGSTNSSSGQYSVSGGFTNTASGESAVALGRNNIASSTRGVSIGDNNNNSTSRGVAIGHDNVVTQAGGSFYAVAIGVANSISSASGSRSYVFGEFNSISANGIRNTAIGYGSSISGSANYAMAINSATATATYSLGKGIFGVAYYYNGETRGGGIAFNGNIGTAQTTDLIAARLVTLTTAGTTVLSLDGTGVTELIIPNGNNRMWNVQIDTIAVVTTITGTATGVTVGNAYRETKQLLFKRVGGTSSIVGTVDTTAIKNDTSMATASLGVTAGASQEMALTFTAPTFSGGGSLTCRVVSKVQLVEVAY